MKIYYSLTILLIISMIGLASAVTIEAGESTIITLPESYASYNITGNSSEVFIIQNGLNVTITISKYEKNNFEIIFFNEKEDVIARHSGDGGWVKPPTKNITNVTNISQQTNLNTNLSSPKDNLPPILNLTSGELNKETKGFFESIGNFFEGIFNWFKRLFK